MIEDLDRADRVGEAMPDFDAVVARVQEVFSQGDPAAAADALAREMWVVFLHAPDLVGPLLSRLPEQVVAERTELRLGSVFAVAHDFNGPPVEAGAVEIPGGLDTSGFTAEEFDGYLVGLMSLHRLRGDYVAAVEVSERLRPRLYGPAWRRSEPMRRVLPALHTLMGQAEILAGNIERGVADFADAAGITDPLAHPDYRRDALVRKAIVHAATGYLTRAESALARARGIPAGDVVDTAMERRERIVEALVAVERMSADAASLVAELDSHPEDEIWPVRLLAGGRWDMARGNPAGALNRVELAGRMRGTPPVGSLAETIMESLRQDALIFMGFASALGEPAAGRAIDGGGSALASVRRRLFTGDPDTALAEARELATRSGGGPSQRVAALLLWLWAFKLTTGAIDPVAAAAVRALVLDEGHWRPLALIPSDLRDEIFGETGRTWATVIPSPGSARLSEREEELLRALAGPATLAQIARDLHISVNTVKTHVRNLYRKLDVNTRADAVAAARSIASS